MRGRPRGHVRRPGASAATALHGASQSPAHSHNGSAGPRGQQPSPDPVGRRRRRRVCTQHARTRKATFGIRWNAYEDIGGEATGSGGRRRAHDEIIAVLDDGIARDEQEQLAVDAVVHPKLRRVHTVPWARWNPISTWSAAAPRMWRVAATWWHRSTKVHPVHRSTKAAPATALISTTQSVKDVTRAVGTAAAMWTRHRVRLSMHAGWPATPAPSMQIVASSRC